MNRSRFASLLFAFASFGLSLGVSPAHALIDSYDLCVERIAEDPDEAFEAAIQWQSLGGGMAARHCVALALSALDLHDEAAFRLEKIAEDMAGAEPWQQAEVLTQAANAWILWGADERAFDLLNKAIELAPGLPSPWIDRARLHMTAGRPFEALGDLNQAVDLAPFRVEALVFRGNAHRHMGNWTKGRDDLLRALELDPNMPEAWLELGNLAKAQGNTDLARSYWLKTRTLGTDGPVAEAALRNLERLDVQIDGGHAEADAPPVSAPPVSDLLPRIEGGIQKSN